jgi:hypothetical protein
MIVARKRSSAAVVSRLEQVLSYESEVKSELAKLYLRLGETKDAQKGKIIVDQIVEIDAELKAKGYMARILCDGCGSNALVKDPKNFWDAHASARDHAYCAHKDQEKDIFGGPMPTGYGWTDELIGVWFLDPNRAPGPFSLSSIPYCKMLEQISSKSASSMRTAGGKLDAPVTEEDVQRRRQTA